MPPARSGRVVPLRLAFVDVETGRPVEGVRWRVRGAEGPAGVLPGEVRVHDGTTETLEAEVEGLPSGWVLAESPRWVVAIRPEVRAVEAVVPLVREVPVRLQVALPRTLSGARWYWVGNAATWYTPGRWRGVERGATHVEVPGVPFVPGLALRLYAALDPGEPALAGWRDGPEGRRRPSPKDPVGVAYAEVTLPDVLPDVLEVTVGVPDREGLEAGIEDTGGALFADEMTAGGLVAGVLVVDRRGDPVPHAHVFAFGAHAASSKDVRDQVLSVSPRTDATGQVELRATFWHPLRIHAWADGRHGVATTTDEGGPLRVTID